MKFFTTSKLSENISTTPEGYLVCLNVSIARTGEQIYGKDELPGIEAGPDGRITIIREAVEVFRPETIASFQGKSLTLWHPDEFVDPKNWTALTKGLVQNVRRGEGAQENDLVADILVTDSRAIELIQGGLREVSCGYEADYVQTGVGRAVQKNIIGNHLAMVDEGRAGAAYAINDHKGEGSTMTLAEKIKAMFKKSEEEAIKLITEDKKGAEEEVKPATLDSVMEFMKTLDKKVTDYMAVASTQPSQSQPAEVKAVDEPKTVEERIAALEASVTKLLESLSAKASDEEEVVEVTDEDEEEEVEVEDKEACDEEEKEAEKTGDAAFASRVEILAPGMKPEGKDVKKKALIACFQTKDGAKVIRSLADKPDFNNEAFVDTAFVAVSELLKVQRAASFSHTRTFDLASSVLSTPKGAMTADELNKKNAEHYK